MRNGAAETIVAGTERDAEVRGGSMIGGML
jgi:hypothetical protein